MDPWKQVGIGEKKKDYNEVAIRQTSDDRIEDLQKQKRPGKRILSRESLILLHRLGSKDQN